MPLILVAILCLFSGLPLLGNEVVEISKTRGNPPSLKIHAQPGSEVKIEGGSDLVNWDILSVLHAESEMVEFHDHLHGDEPAMRFYRITLGGAEAAYAPNFRLLDQAGKSRELYYFSPLTNINGFVLIFTGTGCAAVSNSIPALKALHVEYASKGMTFWMINSKPGDTRANIAAQAAALGIPWPVMHDRAGSVSHAFNAHKTPEVVVVSRKDMRIYYKGALDGGDGSAAHLAQVLGDLAGNKEKTLATVAAIGCDLPAPEHHVDYASEIAPILQAKCVSCHSPGNVAPWFMTNYAIVKMYAPLIADQVLTKEMPPWHADPEHGRFSNDISLSVAEEQKLIAWIRAGAPRGTGVDPLLNVPPPPPEWPAELGAPDMVIECPEQTIKAFGEEPYRYIFVQSGIPSNVWVRAAIVRPSNRAVVHHYLVWEGESMEQMAAGLAGYVPGTTDRAFPAGTGITLTKNTPMTFNLHYTPTGQEEKDKPRLGLWFHKTPPAKQLLTLPVLTQSFVIPAHAQEHEVRISTAELLPGFTLPAATIYSLSPHMHVRGSRMRFELEYPNGTRELLLSVPNYNFHWQTRYYLETPKVAPRGSKLRVIGAFDNSALNPHNPDPTSPVRWGDQSWEEMFIGYIELTWN